MNQVGKPVWGTCTQPLLFPPLYMIERFARCDVVVIMQEAQHSRSAEHSWLQLSSRTGDLQKVSLTCRDKNRRPIDEIKVVDLIGWVDKFRRRLRMTYGKELGYQALGDRLEEILTQLEVHAESYELTLHDVALMTMQWCCKVSGVGTKFINSKSLVSHRPDNAAVWLAELSSAAGVTDYVQGTTSIQSYFLPGVFSARKIRVYGQNWVMPDVPRLGGDQNWHTSVLDTLLVAGPAWVQDAVRSYQGRGEAVGTVKRMAAFE